MRRDQAVGRVFYLLALLTAAVSVAAVAASASQPTVVGGFTLAFLLAWIGHLWRAGSAGREPSLQLLMGVCWRMGLRLDRPDALRATGVVDRLPVTVEVNASPNRSRMSGNTIRISIGVPPGGVFIHDVRREHLGAAPASRLLLDADAEPFVYMVEDQIAVSINMETLPDDEALHAWLVSWIDEARLRATPRADVTDRLEAAARRGSAVALRRLVDDSTQSHRIDDIVEHLCGGPFGEARLIAAQRVGETALWALADDAREEPIWRTRAIEALIKFGGLSRWAADFDRWADTPALRLPVLHGLRFLADDRSHAVVLRIAGLEELDDAACIAVAQALGAMPTEAAEAALVGLLDRENPEVLTAIARALSVAGRRLSTIEALQAIDSDAARRACQAIRGRLDPALGGGLALSTAGGGDLSISPEQTRDRLDTLRDGVAADGAEIGEATPEQAG